MRTHRVSYLVVAMLIVAATIISACGAAPTATPVPPTATKIAAPTATAVPPTAAAVAATATKPAATAAPAAATNTVAAAAPTNTVAAAAATSPTAAGTPAATATTVPAKCDKLPNMPTAAAGAPGSTADKPITLAFVPSGDTGKITKAGTAIAECLQKMTGMYFKIEVGTTFAAAIEAMGADKAQVGFLNTFSILLAQQKYGIIPALINLRKYTTNSVDPDKALAGQQTPYYKGQFIANKASGIKTFADLKGKTFCFVDPASTSGYIIPRIILQANGINPDKDFKNTQNAGSHPNVAIAVYKGDCDAGVTFIDVLTDAAADLKTKYPDITDKVYAFSDTDRIPNDGVQYTKSLDPKVQDAITTAMLAMAADPGGLATLRNLYSIDGFSKLDKPYYDDFAAVLKKAGVDPATLVK